MGAGKYSPTVSYAYSKDKDWWNKNKTNDEGWHDDDGYDSYGYDKNDIDRAGIHESDYLDGRWEGEGENEEFVYPTLERIAAEWENKSPVGIKYIPPEETETSAPKP